MAEEPPVDQSVVDSIRNAKQLFDEGAIDEAEFKAKKRRLLGEPDSREAPPAATPPPAQPASIDLTNDTEAPQPPPPPPAVAPPVPPVAPPVVPPVAPPTVPPIAPPVAPPAAMPPPIAALLTAARAIAQPPRGITANPAALARFPAHDRRVLEARDLHDAVDATFGQDSDDDNEEPPPPFRGSFTDWEDAKYLELLIRYGQPKNENPPAMQKFLEEFGYRARASVTAHVNAFNVGAYKTWRAANGGQWAPFAWVKN